MEEALRLAGQFGFPMVVSLYLLIRFEQRLTDLTDAINKVCLIVDRIERGEDYDGRS